MPTATFEHLTSEKKERILSAAIDEFGARSLREANISNIIREAKIPRGSFYQYFDGLDDLYVYIFETLRAERAEFVRPAFQLYKTEPFLKFYEEFYLRDSEFLIERPSHIALGIRLYSGNDDTSLSLIRRIQNRYAGIFLEAIRFDVERGLISAEVNRASLAELCVHFVTDVFIFQSVLKRLTLTNIHDHAMKTLYIIKNGIDPR